MAFFNIEEYFCRILDGVADAAAFGSMLSILMVLYPERAALIVGLTESLFALGYTIGKNESIGKLSSYFTQ